MLKLWKIKKLIYLKRNNMKWFYKRIIMSHRMESKKEDCLKYIKIGKMFQIYPALEYYTEVWFPRPVPLRIEYKYEYNEKDNIREKMEKSNEEFHKIILLLSLFSSHLYWEYDGKLSRFQEWNNKAKIWQEHIIGGSEIDDFSDINSYEKILNWKVSLKICKENEFLKGIFTKDIKSNIIIAIKMFYDSILPKKLNTTSFALQICALETLIIKPKNNCKECWQKINKDKSSISDSFADLLKDEWIPKAYAKWLYNKRSEFLHSWKKWEIDNNKLTWGKEWWWKVDFDWMFKANSQKEVNKEYEKLIQEHSWFIVDYFILDHTRNITKNILKKAFMNI